MDTWTFTTSFPVKRGAYQLFLYFLSFNQLQSGMQWLLPIIALHI